MFWEAVCNNLGTIVGTAGSIFGVFLGWWLNNWSKRGKLNIYLSEWKDQFKRNQFGVYGNSPSKAEAESYHFYCSLDLHNSSSEAKIMRDFKIVYAKWQVIHCVGYADRNRIRIYRIPCFEKKRYTHLYAIFVGDFVRFSYIRGSSRHV